MAAGGDILRKSAEAVLGLAAAAATAVLLPMLLSRFSPLRAAALRVEAVAAPVLVVAALSAGAWAALRSFRSPGHPAQPRNGRILLFLGTIVLPAAATFLFLLPLMRVWSGAESDGVCAFGIFPWSDGGNYYRGAQELLETGTLDDWNCRRPLNAALLAVRLAFTGGSLQGALLLQCVFLAYAVLMFARTVSGDFGWPGGLLAFALTFVLGRKHLHWVSSESLGLTLGALAFALLWTGARKGRKLPLLTGAATLALALNARAGPFLVLPSLVLWAGLAWRKERGFRRGMAGVVAAGILLGFLLNGSLIRIYGGRWSVGHGNFSLTLYGLATGKPGWQRIYEDFPEARAMPEEALMRFGYDRAAEAFVRDPALLVRGLASSFGVFLERFPAPYKREIGQFAGTTVLWILVAGFLAGIARFLLRSRGKGPSGLLAAYAVGFLASVPFLWVDGGERVLLPAMPALAALAAAGMNGWRQEVSPACGRGEERFPAPAVQAAVLAALLAAAALAGPAVAFRAKGPSGAVPPSPGATPGSLVIRSDSPHISILGRGSSRTTFVPRVRLETYRRNIPGFAKEEFRRLSGPGTLFLARSYSPAHGPKSLYDKFVWVLGPPGMTDGSPKLLLLEGRYVWEQIFFHADRYSELPPPGR